jgi:hypothetical protein
MYLFNTHPTLDYNILKYYKHANKNLLLLESSTMICIQSSIAACSLCLRLMHQDTCDSRCLHTSALEQNMYYTAAAISSSCQLLNTILWLFHPLTTTSLHPRLVLSRLTLVILFERHQNYWWLQEKKPDRPVEQSDAAFYFFLKPPIGFFSKPADNCTISTRFSSSIGFLPRGSEQCSS